MAKVIGSDALGALKTWILNKLSGKSDTGHTHDDRYYTESEIDTKLSGKGTYSKPSTGIPKTDLASAVQTSLGKADSALQSLPSHNHDDRYYTESEIDTKLSGKANTSGTYSGLTVGNATNAQNAGYADYAGAVDWSSIDNLPSTLNIEFTVNGSSYSYNVFYEEV